MAKRKLTIWHIEDDTTQHEYWSGELLEGQIKWKHFETILDAYRAAGNPDYIIFDVGSVGLMQRDAAYLSAFHAIRDRFPHTEIFLVSGLSYLPAMIAEELPDDKLIHPITEADAVSAVEDFLSRAQ